MQASTTQGAADAQTAAGESVAARIRQGRTRWPAPGLAVIPKRLRELFPDEPLGDTLAVAAGLPLDTRWRDLGPDAWDRVSPAWAPDDTWATGLRKRIEARTRRLRDDLVVDWPDGAGWDDVRLSQVTRNALGRAGVTDAGAAAVLTFGHLRRAPWFGTRLMLDFAASVEEIAVLAPRPDRPRPLVLDPRLVLDADLPGPWPAAGLPLLPEPFRRAADAAIRDDLPWPCDESYWDKAAVLPDVPSGRLRAFVSFAAQQEARETVLPAAWPAALASLLPMTARSRGLLDSVGAFDDPDRLASMTYAQADDLGVRPKALLELSCAAEAAVRVLAPLAAQQAAEEPLSRPANWLRLARDPRLGGLVPHDGLLGPSGHSLLRSRLDELDSQTLGDGLADLLRFACGRAWESWTPVLTAKWGWSGDAPLPRKTAADLFGVSINGLGSVERKVQAVLSRVRPEIPALDRAVAVGLRPDGRPLPQDVAGPRLLAEPAVGKAWSAVALAATAELLGRTSPAGSAKATASRAETSLRLHDR